MLLNINHIINIWPLIFACHLTVILASPLEDLAAKYVGNEPIINNLTKNQHNRFNLNDTSKHHNNRPSDVNLFNNNTDLLMAASANKPPFVHFPPTLKPRGFHLPKNRVQQQQQPQPHDVTQTSAQNFYNHFFPNLPSLEHSRASYFNLNEEPLISKFLSQHAKEFQPRHLPLSAYDASLLGSGDFGVLKGGTFYSGEEPPSYINEEGSDIYYGDASNTHSVSSTEGFIQKYTYPEEQFAQFRDFADLSTPSDSAFSQYVVVYANKNSSSSQNNSKPKNIFEQLQEIDKEKALEERKTKKNHTAASSITKLKLVKTKMLEKKWVQKQPIKVVDDDPLIALS